MTWTHFWDMHSGGGAKEQWGHIYIEAPEAEAQVIFFHRFGHNPSRIICTCCGADHSVSESEPGETLRDLTANYMPLDAYLQSDDVHVIYAADIRPEEVA